jgi:hypothetical protein
VSPPAPINEAFNAIVFFYKKALGMELKNVRASPPSRIARQILFH